MKLHKGLVLELDITDLAFGGRGIAKVESGDAEKKEFTIFVDGALPGQQVQARISTKKRRYAEAKLLKVLERSKDEVAAQWQSVPGAPWACLPIKLQQQHKQRQVFELFKKFAHTDVAPVFDEYISSPLEWQYRNKMDYSFGPTAEVRAETGEWQHTGFGLGSKKRGQFWLVENLEQPSGLFDETFESLLPKLRTLCESLNASVYNSRTNQGFWRQLVVRKSFSEDKFLINVITNLDSNGIEAKAVLEFFSAELGERLAGFYWTQSDDTGNANDKYKTRDLLYGTEKITERLEVDGEMLEFGISIDSFFQTNVKSAEKLYAKAAEYTGESDHILELFAGTGTISQILARQNPKAQITSVEIIEAAVKDAKENTALNSISNINFVCDDVFKFLKTYTDTPPTVVLDPPRAGIAPKALLKIIEFAPQQIVYISCNPATLARDTEMLQKNGYMLKQLSLIDQFPHSSHVECVVKFQKNNEIL